MFLGNIFCFLNGKSFLKCGTNFVHWIRTLSDRKFQINPLVFTLLDFQFHFQPQLTLSFFYQSFIEPFSIFKWALNTRPLDDLHCISNVRDKTCQKSSQFWLCSMLKRNILQNHRLGFLYHSLNQFLYCRKTFNTERWELACCIGFITEQKCKKIY